MKNTGTSMLQLKDIVIAAWPPGSVITAMPVIALGHTAALAVAPGQAVRVQQTRLFTQLDVVGRWFASASYQTQDGVWHSDPTVATFIVF